MYYNPKKDLIQLSDKNLISAIEQYIVIYGTCEVFMLGLKEQLDNSILSYSNGEITLPELIEIKQKLTDKFKNKLP